ncbi:MAG: ribosome biogenesis GTPase Der [Cryomorphaceae bacterium]|nr:MAG: ribosome biogenesis GTPase Der [Cryomorphaceae bacterium]
MRKVVAIVGRPNVGKSTLFNRLTESRDAIVDSVSGVTRDRHYGIAEWNGVRFSVIDTGGYTINSEDVFEQAIRRQVELAVEESNVILYLVDWQSGITDYDEAIARLLRKSGKEVLLVCNKIDSPDKTPLAAEFYSLGLGEVYTVSAVNGGGTGDMLDALVELLGKPVAEEEDPDIPRFAVVGRPNVGKSSLINALTGEDRNIVTDVAGTTRDTIGTRYRSYGFDFLLMDTAGIRKKAKVHDDLEFYSVIRSIRAIESSDVCFLLIDALEGLEKQDLNIFSMILKNKKGVVILVNKWDVYEKDQHSTRKLEEEIREKLAPFNDVPILFVSAITKQRIHKALETGIEVFQNRKQRISTSRLNDVMLEIIERTPPPAIKGKYVRIKYVTQIPTHVPSFVFFCNLPQYIKDPYKRFVENKLRENFSFTGVPINVFFRQK